MNPFKTKNNQIVIGQKPNAPLIVWFFAFVCTKLPLNHTLIQLCEVVSFGALFTWAWLEIFQGVNLFRRILGIAVMIGIVYLRL